MLCVHRKESPLCFNNALLSCFYRANLFAKAGGRIVLITVRPVSSGHPLLGHGQLSHSRKLTTQLERHKTSARGHDRLTRDDGLQFAIFNIILILFLKKKKLN